MSEQLPAHTLHAQQGLEFADVLSFKFKDRNVGTPPRHLRLREPDGPSTAGGKLARQSLVLQNDAGDALVCGWVDLSARTAEVRSFAYISEQFHQRRGHIVDIASADYEALVEELTAFLKVSRLDVTRAERMPVAGAASAPKTRRAPPVALILVLSLLVGLALGYLIFG